LTTTEALSRGITPDDLRGPRWRSPTRGVHERADTPSNLVARCRSVQLVLPTTSVFTHLTAGHLHGLWLPSGPPGWAVHPQVNLIAAVPTDKARFATHQDRRGVYIRRCAIPPEHRRSLAGVRVASPVWTLVDLAEDLALIDLVTAMDSALRLGLCDSVELTAAAVAGRRGVRTYRRAVALADGRSESPWETVLRLLHVLAGITEVEPQHEMRAEDGELLGRGDLWLRGTRRWVEYDGAVHRDAAVHQRDVRRDKWLARIRWERYGYVAKEIHVQPGMILDDAEAALGLHHDPRRLEAWLREYRLCSLSPPGARRLSRRLTRYERSTPPRRRGPSRRRPGSPDRPGRASCAAAGTATGSADADVAIRAIAG